MSYWSWDSSLSVGIDVIDGQHRRIVDYLNDLDEAHRNQDRDKVSEVLHALVDYTITHLAFEEQLMEKAGYPLTEPHQRVHQAFVERINRYREQHQAGKEVTRKLMSDLKLWLGNHIRNDDKHYAPYVMKSLAKQQSWMGKALKRLFG